MSQEQAYKLTQGTHSTIKEGRRVRIGPGAIFVPSTAEIKAFQDRLELVEDKQPEDPPRVEDPDPNQDDEKPQSEWPKHRGGPWYELPNGEKIQGKEEADAAYKALMEEEGE